MINFRKIVLLLVVPGALALPGAAKAATYPTTAAGVAVYDINIGQMKPEYNWKGWAQSIKNETLAPLPDVILGQDFNGLPQVDDFLDQINHVFAPDAYTYAASDLTFNFPNRRVVFWRVARFSLLKSETWYGWGESNLSLPCQEGAQNTAAIQVQLQDLAAPTKVVSAVSMKTQPRGTDNDCAWKNMQKATAKLARPLWAGSMHLIGTDTNAPDWNSSNGQWNCWYRNSITALPSTTGCGTATDLGWADIMFDNCDPPANRRPCLDLHWTHAPFNRIDYIFAKIPATPGVGPTSTDRKTIDKQVCSTYSDHCSVRGIVNYV